MVSLELLARCLGRLAALHEEAVSEVDAWYVEDVEELLIALGVDPHVRHATVLAPPPMPTPEPADSEVVTVPGTPTSKSSQRLSAVKATIHFGDPRCESCGGTGIDGDAKCRNCRKT